MTVVGRHFDGTANFYKLRGVTSHKTAIFVVTTSTASNLTLHTNTVIRNARNATANPNRSHGITTS